MRMMRLSFGLIVAAAGLSQVSAAAPAGPSAVCHMAVLPPEPAFPGYQPTNATRSCAQLTRTLEALQSDFASFKRAQRSQYDAVSKMQQLQRGRQCASGVQAYLALRQVQYQAFYQSLDERLKETIARCR